MPSELVHLPRTREAIATIVDDNLRRDVSVLLDGVEIGFSNDGCSDIGHWSAGALASMVFALHRTISDDVSAAILEALWEESEPHTALRLSLGYTNSKNSKCDIRPGTPVGSSTCTSQKNSTCISFGGSGCGGTSGGSFGFVWEYLKRI